MTLTISLLACAVAGAAAVRSTWSPCGLSMMSTITPFAERARGHRYGATCTWFVAGATAGGLVLGAGMAALAALVRGLGPAPVAAGTIGLLVALVALVSDTGLAGVRLPFHGRQVNERWLDAYRPWVYGAGFGFQIGVGVATYITTAAVYVLVVFGALTGEPVVALALGGAFGLVRGLAVTLTRRVTDPSQLLRFHQRFAALLPWADRGVAVSLAASALALGLAVGPEASVPAVAAVVVLTVVARAVRSRRDRRGSPTQHGGTPDAERPSSVAVG